MSVASISGTNIPNDKWLSKLVFCLCVSGRISQFGGYTEVGK